MEDNRYTCVVVSCMVVMSDGQYIEFDGFLSIENGCAIIRRWGDVVAAFAPNAWREAHQIPFLPKLKKWQDRPADDLAKTEVKP